jgi:hypothetical protein
LTATTADGSGVCPRAPPSGPGANDTDIGHATAVLGDTDTPDALLDDERRERRRRQDGACIVVGEAPPFPGSVCRPARCGSSWEIGWRALVR